MIAHWMATAVKRAGLPNADRLVFAPDTSVHDVWTAACKECDVQPQELAAAIAKAFSMETVDLTGAEPTAAKLLPGSIARKFCVFPVRDENRYLVVATPNPTDLNADQEVGFTSGRIARFAVAPPMAISGAIESAYSADHAAASMLERLGREADLAKVEFELPSDAPAPEKILEADLAGPVVRLANIILHEAVRHRASDIHIQPLASSGVVRFRTDGVLHNAMQLPLPVLARVVSRIKIMAQLDITDRLRPQDGRTRMVVDGRKYDLRVSTVPTRGAEKAVIRLLDPERGGTLAKTGIGPYDVERLRRALTNRDGVVVVTGPTGSGKTTTLYGALGEIATDDVNIMTVEDPVEYEVAGLTQIQVEQKQGMTFASALRAILRQDPDVIFVGEIRDAETAEIAAQASLTGHLVLSTLHTNDAIGAIRRFLDLGLSAATVSETLRGALAQRLVRRVCSSCAERVGADLTAQEAELAARYGARPVVRAQGCDECMSSGYPGRLPVTEFILATPELQHLIESGAPASELRKQAARDGMVTLRESALERIRAGETTLQEVERVIGHAEEEEEDGDAASSAGAVTVDGPGPIVSPPEPLTILHSPEVLRAAPAAASPSRAPVAAVASSPAAPVATATIPAAPSRLVVHAAPPAAPAPIEPSEDQPHILVVDDDGTTRTIARGVFEATGYRVSEARDGAEALVRLARGEHFSLMLLDLDMPNIGGRDVLRSVRQSMATVGLPVVVLTGAPDHGTEVELMEMGADDYLRKPIDPPLLSIRIKAAMRRARG
ncbi:MAG: type II/IV secretion system protein [Gemmatimonadetes bacterium]|nr:type II/IV secretion system protein [Gemmatimonadota bacterium]